MSENNSYRNNQNLKKPGTKINWTKELISEYIKCKKDIVYFAENYFKIVVEKGIQLIKLRDYQKEMLKSMQENRFSIFCCARQSGKTEIFRIFLTHYILFNDFKTVAILANKAETAREILSKLQLSYQNLPLWLQLAVKDFNKGTFTLENNSRIIATSTSKNSARGFTAHAVILDEAAFIENFNEFYSAVYPVISAGEDTKLIMCSTPNGLNHFYDFWQGAKAGVNGFYPIFVPWDRVPGRDEKWKKETLEGMNNDIQKFQVEFSCEFQGSSGTLIAGYKLKQLVGSHKIPIVEDENLKLKMYEKPVKELVRIVDEIKETLPAHKYFLIADVSRGKGSDYSAFSIFDCTELPYRQVCTFRDNEISPADYAEIIYKTASLYNGANVLVEINDIGEQIGYMLMMEFGYENVLCTETSSTKGKRISFGGKKADKGIRTTKFVKALGCSFLKLLIEQDKIILNDEETIYELTTFSKKKLSYEAEHGKHDDLVMGLVLFAWLTDQNYFKEVTEINTAMSFRQNNEEDINNRLTPFGFINGILGPPKKYKEYYESLNMNIPFREFVEDVEVGKTEVFDGSLWTYAEYKAKY